MYRLRSIGYPWDKFQLSTGAYRLGSARDNEIVLEDPSVAAHHCEVVVTANTITLRHLRGTHETYVDDQQVQSTLLKSGQTLRLGNKILVLEGNVEGAAGVVSASDPSQTNTMAAAMKRARLVKPALWIGSLLLALVAIVFLANLRWPDWPTLPSRRSPATGTIDSKASSPLLEAPKPVTESVPADAPPQAFDPSQTNRAPNLDVQAAEAEVRKGNYRRAEPFLRRALQNQQKSLGAEHPEVTKTLRTLGNVHRSAHRYKEAEPLMQQTLKNVQKVPGPEHPETATALDNLGELYLASGQLPRAEPLLERARAIREKALPAGHRDLGASLNNLAALNTAKGDYAKAKPLLEQAMKISTLGTNDPSVAQSLNNLGELHRALGDSTKAEPLFQEALKIKDRALRPDDPSIAATLNSLASLLTAKGDYAKAEPLYKRALQITERAFGPDHPHTAASLNHLGRVHQKAGDDAKAAPLYERAAKIAEKALGPDHPQTATTLDNLAGLQLCQADQDSGRQLVRQALQAKLKLRAALVWYASEPERLAYRNHANPYTLAAASRDIPELASIILQHKGVVLDALLEDRLITAAGAKPENKVLVDKLRATKEGLAQMVFETPEDFSPSAQEHRQEDMKTLAAYLTQLQRLLEGQVARLGRANRALSVTSEQVKWAIPEHGALLEFVRYSRCLGTNQWVPCYGAVVLASVGAPVWVSLGSAEAIEKNIESLQNPDQGEAPEQTLATLLQSLYQQLWAPVEPLLPAGAKTVIISPDAALNLVSFAALLTPGDEFLSQKYSIRYVSSGRDLLGEKKAFRKSPVLILGNPDFSSHRFTPLQGSETNLTARGGPDRQELQALRWPALSSAAQEVALLNLQASRWGWPISLFFGAEATETQLASLNSPRILHLATSGFILPDAGGEEHGGPEGMESPYRPSFLSAPLNGGLMPVSAQMLVGPMVVRNPIHRSGLALAGAQATLKAWESGETPPPSQDGIMTAAEAGTLNLEGTELVVMSACHLGTGPMPSGEGVLALRRAFIQTGAQSLLIRLWPTADEDIPKLLEDFYTQYQGSRAVPQAFADVQRNWLVRLRRERGLAAALRVAGSFLMNSQGPVQ